MLRPLYSDTLHSETLDIKTLHIQTLESDTLDTDILDTDTLDTEILTLTHWILETETLDTLDTDTLDSLDELSERTEVQKCILKKLSFGENQNEIELTFTNILKSGYMNYPNCPIKS